MGGVWERMVNVAKRHLKTIVGDQLLNDFELRTLFTEAEALMNSRPLTPGLCDPQDLESLTLILPLSPSAEGRQVAPRSVSRERLFRATTVAEGAIPG